MDSQMPNNKKGKGKNLDLQLGVKADSTLLRLNCHMVTASILLKITKSNNTHTVL